MATIDRFFTPAQLAVQSLVVPQAVPLPIDDLQNLVDRRQQNFDDVAQIGSGILGLDVGAIPQDVEIRNASIQEFENEFNTLADNVGGDLSQIRRESTNLARRIQTDTTRGKLAAIKDRFDKRNAFIDNLKKISTGKDAIISPDTANTFLAMSDSINRNLVNAQGGFNSFQTIDPVKEVNAIERGLELTRRVAEDGSGGFKLTNDGLIVTSKGERVTRDKAFRAAFQALSKDQEALNSIDQDIVLGSFRGQQFNMADLDAFINSVANTLRDGNLKANVESLIDLDPRSKLRAVEILKASDAVANQISFNKFSQTAKETSEGFFDRVNAPDSVLVRSQAVPVGRINSVNGESLQSLESIFRDVDPKELDKRSSTKGKQVAEAVDKWVKSYVNKQGIDGFLEPGAKKVVEGSAKFIASIFQPDKELDRTSLDYQAVASNIDGFGLLPPELQDQRVVEFVTNQLDSQGDFEFSLDNRAKTIKEKNLILFGNDKGDRGEDELLNGAFSSFTFINPEGDILSAQEFRNEIGDKNVRVKGVVTNIGSPLELGSTVLTIDAVDWFMSPTESTRNTDEWLANEAKRAKFAPTKVRAFTDRNGINRVFRYDKNLKDANGNRVGGVVEVIQE